MPKVIEQFRAVYRGRLSGTMHDSTDWYETYGEALHAGKEKEWDHFSVEKEFIRIPNGDT